MLLSVFEFKLGVIKLLHYKCKCTMILSVKSNIIWSVSYEAPTEFWEIKAYSLGD